MKKYVYNKQPMFVGNDTYPEIGKLLEADDKILLVHGRSYNGLPIRVVMENLPQETVDFTGYSPNPKYEEVVAGRELFLKEKCTCIISVGGGSAIDTAKNIKLFAAMDECDNYLEAEKKSSAVRHIAIPTTAGTGSESNRNSVLYKDGVKQSIKHESILPDAAFIIPELIDVLPDYQKRSTMLDALCQCFESIWAAASTYESRSYAMRGLNFAVSYMDTYLKGDRSANEYIMLAANFSGRGTNISQTTAAHAMSYKLASMYGISHGHAVALSLPHICRYAIRHPEEVTDSLTDNEIAAQFASSEGWLINTLYLLLGIMLPGETELEALPDRLQEIVDGMGFDKLQLRSEEDLDVLVASVNPLRLGNNPVKLSQEVLKDIYRKVFE